MNAVVVVVGTLRDPGLAKVGSRPRLIVTGDDAPPARHLGANVVGMGVGALSVVDLGHGSFVVAAADGELAGRALAKSDRWRVALVVLGRGQTKAVRLRDVAAAASQDGRRVVVVELVPGMCLELGFLDGSVVGIPEIGIRSWLTPETPEAPSAPTEGPGTPHPDAPPALHSMVVPDPAEEIPEPVDLPADPVPKAQPASARRQKPPKKQTIV